MRQARLVLDEEHGTHLDDGAFVAALCAGVIDAAPAGEPTGRAKFQIAMNIRRSRARSYGGAPASDIRSTSGILIPGQRDLLVLVEPGSAQSHAVAPRELQRVLLGHAPSMHLRGELLGEVRSSTGSRSSKLPGRRPID